MQETIAYLSVLILILIYCIAKHKGVLGIILLALYTGEAVFSVLCLKNDSLRIMLSDYRITLGPYVLLVVSLLLYFSPFLHANKIFSASKYVTRVNLKYVGFAYIYIICGVITLLCCLPTLITMVQAGNWSESYGEGSVLPYNNFIEYFATNFCSYLRILAIIVGFSMMRDDNYKKRHIIPIALLGVAGGTAISDAILSTSRSMLYDIAILVLMVYVFFYSQMEKNKKRFVTVITSIAAVAILALFVNITISRFSSRGTMDFVLSYLGQAPVVFNSQVVGTVDKFSYGYYAFGQLFSNESFNQMEVGGTWDARFYMFTGWIYLDWGPVGLLMIGIIVAYALDKLVKKKEYVISDLYLLFSYLLILLKGVFVIGRGYCYNIVASVFIYIILKIFFDKYVFVIGKHRL